MPNRSASRTLSRRAAIARLAGCASALLSGCVPVQLLRVHRSSTGQDRESTALVLDGFIETVVPGAGRDGRRYHTVFRDPFYRFEPYAAWFANDLTRRARRIDDASFERLSAPLRTAVVRAGLDGDIVTRKIYTGAVFLAQIAVCGAVGDDGAELIRYEGRYRFRGLEAVTHPSPRRFLATPLTPDGNHA